MKKRPPRTSIRAVRDPVNPWPLRTCVLRLFVAGASVRSHQAILRVRELCANELKGQCALEVIDIYQQPGLARDSQILATPTLIREFPRPIRRLIGNLTNQAQLLSGLDLGSVREAALR